MFKNRKRELRYLTERYSRAGAELTVLYGRRRVGKSALLYEWCHDKPHLYFFAARLPERALLAEFSRQVGAHLAEPDVQFLDWSDAFTALSRLGGGKRFVVVIDEYPYLAESVPGLSTILQRGWDMRLQHSKLFLCLAGSAHSVVRREILDGDAPLYRRHTWAYELQPLGIADCHEFLAPYGAEQLVEAYATFGGMPRNLVLMSADRDLMHNIRSEILRPSGSLFNEPRLLLHEELKGEVDAFSRVLEAISAGHHQRNEIAAACNLTLPSTQHYLNDLLAAGLVEHRRPLSRVPDHARQGTYHIIDPFLRFWHCWVAPHKRLLDIDQGERAVLGDIRKSLAQVVSPVWEELARRFLLEGSAKNALPVKVEEVGSWWTRDAQIDIVAVNRTQKQVVFGEARWRSKRLSSTDVDALVQKSLLWLKGDTSRWETHYAFFAREFARIDHVLDDNVHFFTPEDIVSTSARNS